MKKAQKRRFPLTEKWCALTLTLLLALSLTACEEKEERLPAPAPAQSEASGALQAGLLSEVDPDAFESVETKVLDEGGEQVALCTDGLLLSLSVEYGTLNPDGTEYIAEQTVFECSQFGKDQLLVLETYFSDVVPNLRVRYEDADGEQDLFLFQSGRDGSILLLPVDEVLAGSEAAVG